jgi:hypothetical protein
MSDEKQKVRNCFYGGDIMNEKVHKSTGHFGPQEWSTEYISDGALCDKQQHMFSSADWIAVDCPKCLAMRAMHEKEMAEKYKEAMRCKN